MNCSFCKKGIEKGTGKIYVTKTGNVFYFCSSKCEKNFKLGRNPRKLAWIKKKKK